MYNERPFVFINTAITADGKIDTVARKGASISSPIDIERVDRLRAESDAIMVGGRTLLQEDPKLTVKSPILRAQRLERGLAENPMKVGIVSRIEDPQDKQSKGSRTTAISSTSALLAWWYSQPSSQIEPKSAACKNAGLGSSWSVRSG